MSKDYVLQDIQILSLQKLIKNCIVDESQEQAEFHKGRVSAFKYILGILEDDEKLCCKMS